MPLGTQRLFAFSKVLCELPREHREDHASWAASDLAKALQTATEKHIWLQLLRAPAHERTVSGDWEELAEEFVLWLGKAVVKSRSLQEAVRQLSLGHAVVLAAWWAYLTCSKAGKIRKPSVMTSVVLA